MGEESDELRHGVESICTSGAMDSAKGLDFFLRIYRGIFGLSDWRFKMQQAEPRARGKRMPQRRRARRFGVHRSTDCGSQALRQFVRATLSVRADRVLIDERAGNVMIELHPHLSPAFLGFRSPRIQEQGCA